VKGERRVSTPNGPSRTGITSNAQHPMTEDRTSNSERFETRSLPTLTHCFSRNFTFYVAHPIRSIRERASNIQLRGEGSASRKAESYAVQLEDWIFKGFECYTDVN
jgi:hypothetical protein